MKFIGLAILIFTAHLGTAQATTESATINEFNVLAVPLTAAQPCSYWTYNTNGGGYSCQSYQFNVQIPDGYAVNSELANLNERIRRLEAKIGALETAAARR